MRVAGKSSRVGSRAAGDAGAAGAAGDAGATEGDTATRKGRAGPQRIDDHTTRALRERAMAAMERAYAPYSSFLVGAALLGTDGSITEACNVENAAFPAGTCAERAALASAIARGIRSFSVLAIASSADEPTPPCGMCRQALIEFAPDLDIMSVTRSGKEKRWRLAELLPDAFSPRSLDRKTD